MREIKGLEPSEIRSILIVELTRLGDVVAMLPAVRLLAHHYTQASVTMLVDEQYAKLVRVAGLRCDVVGIQKPESFSGFLRAVTRARNLKADLALSMSPPKRNAAVTLASGARRKVGYLTYVNSLAPYLETTPVEAFGCITYGMENYGRENIEDRALKICKALGVIPGTYSTSGKGIAQIDARGLSSGRNHVPRRPFVVLHPFSGWEFRSWPLGNFTRIASMILAAGDYDVVFLCEKGEEGKLDPAKSELGGREDVHFVASDDLVYTATLLQRAAVVVCNDSGPLHLAAALGTGVVGLFGPAPPALTGPRGARGEFLFKHVECSPCNQTVCVRPTESCMTLITPDEVFGAVARQLRSVSQAEPVANA